MLIFETHKHTLYTLTVEFLMVTRTVYFFFLCNFLYLPSSYFSIAKLLVSISYLQLNRLNIQQQSVPPVMDLLLCQTETSAHSISSAMKQSRSKNFIPIAVVRTQMMSCYLCYDGADLCLLHSYRICLCYGYFFLSGNI